MLEAHLCQGQVQASTQERTPTTLSCFLDQWTPGDMLWGLFPGRIAGVFKLPHQQDAEPGACRPPGPWAGCGS